MVRKMFGWNTSESRKKYAVIKRLHLINETPDLTAKTKEVPTILATKLYKILYWEFFALK